MGDITFMKYLLMLFKKNTWGFVFSHPVLFLSIIIHILGNPKLIKIENNVKGLISITEGIILYDSVMKSKNMSPNVLEVGAFQGKSTCFLSLASSKVGKRVKSFELFSGLPTADCLLDPAFQKGQYSSDVDCYTHHLTSHGCLDAVDLTIGDARQSMPLQINGNGYSVAFLDTDVYEVTKELLFQLLKLAKGKETIYIHDIDSPGIRKAVNELKAYHPMKESVLLRTLTKLEFNIA